MRWALSTSVAILVLVPVFSSPIPRLLLQRRGLFDDTLTATGYTVNEIAAMVANALTDDPAPCEYRTSSCHFTDRYVCKVPTFFHSSNRLQMAKRRAERRP